MNDCPIPLPNQLAYQQAANSLLHNFSIHVAIYPPNATKCEGFKSSGKHSLKERTYKINHFARNLLSFVNIKFDFNTKVEKLKLGTKFMSPVNNRKLNSFPILWPISLPQKRHYRPPNFFCLNSTKYPDFSQIFN